MLILKCVKNIKKKHFLFSENSKKYELLKWYIKTFWRHFLKKMCASGILNIKNWRKILIHFQNKCVSNVLDWISPDVVTAMSKIRMISLNDFELCKSTPHKQIHWKEVKKSWKIRRCFVKCICVCVAVLSRDFHSLTTNRTDHYFLSHRARVTKFCLHSFSVLTFHSWKFIICEIVIVRKCWIINKITYIFFSLSLLVQ
jgi:hypothetical protein